MDSREAPYGIGGVRATDGGTSVGWGCGSSSKSSWSSSKPEVLICLLSSFFLVNCAYIFFKVTEPKAKGALSSIKGVGRQKPECMRIRVMIEVHTQQRQTKYKR